MFLYAEAFLGEPVDVLFNVAFGASDDDQPVGLDRLEKRQGLRLGCEQFGAAFLFAKKHTHASHNPFSFVAFKRPPR
jgi:hypothetical protein